MASRGRQAGCCGLVLLVLGVVSPPGAQAQTGIGLEGGLSPARDADAVRVQVFGGLGRGWRPGSSWYLQPFWELSLSRLQAERGSGGNDALYAGAARFGIRSPVPPLSRLFLEAATGPVVLSEEGLGRTDLGSHIQFRSHIGIGGYLDGPRRLSLAYRFSHTSNASLGEPNPGLDFHALQLGLRF